ncbi:ATP-binding protein [Streptomyces syringium]|uniref:ATP-binding protein n=1 Tax=Streptomyces syringium TaxID=76729 RepID=UPI00364BC918
MIARHSKVDLLCLDEFGYLNLDKKGARLLFQIFTEREECKATAVATNSPFAGWDKIFADPRLCAAIADRITFRCTLIQTGTESYRFHATEAERKAKANGELVRRLLPGDLLDLKVDKLRRTSDSNSDITDQKSVGHRRCRIIRLIALDPECLLGSGSRECPLLPLLVKEPVHLGLVGLESLWRDLGMVPGSRFHDPCLQLLHQDVVWPRNCRHPCLLHPEQPAIRKRLSRPARQANADHPGA